MRHETGERAHSKPPGSPSRARSSLQTAIRGELGDLDRFLAAPFRLAHLVLTGRGGSGALAETLVEMASAVEDAVRRPVRWAQDALGEIPGADARGQGGRAVRGSARPSRGNRAASRHHARDARQDAGDGGAVPDARRD